MTNRTLIKPCPFCGAENPKIHREKLIYIQCQNCGCRTSYLCVEDVAIERWNRRTDDKYEIVNDDVRRISDG